MFNFISSINWSTNFSNLFEIFNTFVSSIFPLVSFALAIVVAFSIMAFIKYFIFDFIHNFYTTNNSDYFVSNFERGYSAGLRGLGFLTGFRDSFKDYKGFLDTSLEKSLTGSPDYLQDYLFLEGNLTPDDIYINKKKNK